MKRRARLARREHPQPGADGVVQQARPNAKAVWLCICVPVATKDGMLYSGVNLFATQYNMFAQKLIFVRRLHSSLHERAAEQHVTSGAQQHARAAEPESAWRKASCGDVRVRRASALTTGLAKFALPHGWTGVPLQLRGLLPYPTFQALLLRCKGACCALRSTFWCCACRQLQVGWC